MVTQVTGKNQVTIPATIAREYGIEVGSRIDWLPGDKPNEIRVQIQPTTSERLRCVRKIGAKYAGRVPDSGVLLSQVRDNEESVRAQSIVTNSRKANKRANAP
jgi:bifunctional DNA-binding transcriptional regulator/antitoxin component of YhaV-PrlF toxin-antitoxin module